MPIPNSLRHAHISRNEVTLQAFITQDGNVIPFGDQFGIPNLPKTVTEFLNCGFIIMETAPETIHPRFR